MVNKWGWLDTVNEGMSKLLRNFKEIQQFNLKDATLQLEEEKQKLIELEEKHKEAWNFNKARYRAQITMAKQRIAQINTRIALINKETEAEQEATAKKQVEAQKRAEAEKLEIDQAKQKSDAKKQLIVEETAAKREAAREEEEINRLLMEEAEQDFQELEKQYEKKAKAAKEANDKIVAANKRMASSMADELTDFVMTGKLQFEDFAKSIVAQLVKIRIQQALVQSMSGTSMGMTLGFHTGTTEVKHTGGAIGGGAHIPSYHTGMRTDERMAKLQVGEAVVNRAGARNNAAAIDAMNRGQKISTGGNVTTAEINFNVTAIDSASFNNYLMTNKNTIEGIINRSLTTNGSVRQTIKQVV